MEAHFKVKNKNDNIHKIKTQDSDDQTNIDKYRVAANIREYHIISKSVSYSKVEMLLKQIFKKLYKNFTYF